MKFLEKLDRAVKKNNSLLCLGLDIDLNRIPSNLLKSDDPIFIFNQTIIDATRDLVCAYKPNMAFYEMYGVDGLSSLIKTIEYIQATDIPVILDAKRGDVGHSSVAYAKAIFEVFKADATTVNPYLGHDSVEPFIEYRDKGVFILCLTSNIGFKDFQMSGTGEPLYKSVVVHAKEWNHWGNCGLVVGATKPEQLKEIHEMVPDMPLLIPGIGAQGGDLEASVKFGGKRAILNASRSVLYAAKPQEETQKLRDGINKFR